MFEVATPTQQLTSLYPDVTHVIKSSRLSPTFQCLAVIRLCSRGEPGNEAKSKVKDINKEGPLDNHNCYIAPLVLTSCELELIIQPMCS